MIFGYWDVAEGAADLHEHDHQQEEVWNVVDGEILLVVDGCERRLGPGDAAVVPPGTRHSARPVGAARAIVVDHPLRLQLPGSPSPRPAGGVDSAGRPPADRPSSSYELEPIGWVESSLTERATAPHQGDEGAPDAWLAFEDAVAEGLRDLRPGSEVLVLTWLHRADRAVLRTHPRGNPASPERGVFSTRSPDRPNPIGLHRVEITSVEGTRIHVRSLEAVDGTPIVDVKPVLGGLAER